MGHLPPLHSAVYFDPTDTIYEFLRFLQSLQSAAINDPLLKFIPSKNRLGCKIFSCHLLCNGKLYLKTNFIHSRYIFTPLFLFNLQKFSRPISTFLKMHSEVVFRFLWKHIFHELFFILSQNRNYYTDRFSFDSTRKIFFFTGVNIS